MAFRARGVGLRVPNPGGHDVDTGTPMGSIMFTVMAAPAQTTLEIKRERIADLVSERRAVGSTWSCAMPGRPRVTRPDMQKMEMNHIEGGGPASFTWVGKGAWMNGFPVGHSGPLRQTVILAWCITRWFCCLCQAMVLDRTYPPIRAHRRACGGKRTRRRAWNRIDRPHPSFRRVDSSSKRLCVP